MHHMSYLHSYCKVEQGFEQRSEDWRRVEATGASVFCLMGRGLVRLGGVGKALTHGIGCEVSSGLLGFIDHVGGNRLGFIESLLHLVLVLKEEGSEHAAVDLEAAVVVTGDHAVDQEPALAE